MKIISKKAKVVGIIKRIDFRNWNRKVTKVGKKGRQNVSNNVGKNQHGFYKTTAGHVENLCIE